MLNKYRLDAYLVEKEMATGREKAKELIASGAVTVNGKVVTKPSFSVCDEDRVACSNTAFAYVSRGALKLEKALDLSRVSVEGCVALDIGASTGGFTQCLLRHGASRVFAVDVGHDQLHPTLREDPRVMNLEGTDVRSQRLCETVPENSVDIITMDVSFISIRQVLPCIFPFLKKGGHAIVLIKPQFEAGRADVGKNGIVRDRRVHVRVIRELLDFFAQHSCCVQWLGGSPIVGGAGRNRGNIEYLAVLSLDESATSPIWDVRRIVDETFSLLSEG